MPELHQSIDCLINCEVLPKVAAHRANYDLAGIIAHLAMEQMFLSLHHVADNRDGWALRLSCDQPDCPCPLDGTDAGVDKFLWEVINRYDLTNRLPADEAARVAAGAASAADWAARAE